MKQNPYVLRALYIILVPMILLIILLNSGFLQRFIPAATVNGESCSVIRYNYYYYDYQTTFLHAHEAELEQLGYDTNKDADRQQYDSAMTWKEFFQQGAEANLAEVAYYCNLAEQDGYVFSDKELSPVAKRLEENAATATKSGIKMDNYYVAYYGPGMNEERYAAELTRVVKAEAYKQHLLDSYEAEDAALADYLSQHPGEDYRAVNLQLIVLHATPDRFSGEVGAAQLDALQSKLDALVLRYEEGVPFAQLQQSFSQSEETEMVLTRESGLPAALVKYYIDGAMTDEEEPAAHFAYVDQESGTAYFTLRTGYEPSGREVTATMALGADAVEAQQAEQVSAYMPVHKTFGMLLSAS